MFALYCLSSGKTLKKCSSQTPKIPVEHTPAIDLPITELQSNLRNAATTIHADHLDADGHKVTKTERILVDSSCRDLVTRLISEAHGQQHYGCNVVRSNLKKR